MSVTVCSCSSPEKNISWRDSFCGLMCTPLLLGWQRKCGEGGFPWRQRPQPPQHPGCHHSRSHTSHTTNLHRIVRCHTCVHRFPQPPHIHITRTPSGVRCGCWALLIAWLTITISPSIHMTHPLIFRCISVKSKHKLDGISILKCVLHEECSYDDNNAHFWIYSW